MRNGNKMSDLGITNLIQPWQYANTCNRYVAVYKIGDSQVFEHELTSCDYRFIFLERMKYDIYEICESLLLDGDDCMKWCRQANKLIGILNQEKVFLPDDMFAFMTHIRSLWTTSLSQMLNITGTKV